MPSAINQKIELLDNLTTSTWYDVRKEYVETAYKITPFYNRLMEKGQIKSKVPDGTHFEIPISYDKQNQNTKYFGRGTSFGVSEKESLTRLVYYTKNLGTSLVRFYDDDRKNRSKAQIIDYAKYLVDNAKNSLIDTLETDLLSQNADPNSFDALPSLIATDPTTGTIGTLTRVGNTFLQNQTKSFSGLTTTNSLIDEMTSMYNKCSLYKGGSQRTPDIILTTREVYEDYERIARAMQTIQTNKSERASLGFGDLMFKNVEMFWAPSCPAGSMYMLNTETLEFNYDPAAWFEMTEWKSVAGTSLDRTAQIICVGNLCCANPQKNGVIHSITTVTNA